MYLYLDFASVIIDKDRLDGAGTIRCGARRLKVVLVGSSHPVRLEPPPTGGVVGDGTAVTAVESHMTFVVCTCKREGGRGKNKKINPK